MKKISEKEIRKKIKKEYEVGREWNSYDHFRYFKLMIDTNDAETWTDCFLNCDEWKVYHSKTIIRIPHPYYCETIQETEAAYTEEAIKILKEAGWTITK